MIQLELNTQQETELEIKLRNMQLQIDSMNDSMNKVRKKLFAQVGELQKICHTLETQNQELIQKLKDITGEKANWQYLQGESLFEIA